MQNYIKQLKITNSEDISCYNTICQKIFKKNNNILIFNVESYKEYSIYDDDYVTYELYGYVNLYNSQKNKLALKCHSKIEIHKKYLRTIVSINDLIDLIQKKIDEKTDKYLDCLCLISEEPPTEEKHNKKKKEKINKFEIDYADDENTIEPAQSNPIII